MIQNVLMPLNQKQRERALRGLSQGLGRYLRGNPDSPNARMLYEKIKNRLSLVEEEKPIKDFYKVN